MIQALATVVAQIADPVRIGLLLLAFIVTRLGETSTGRFIGLCIGNVIVALCIPFLFLGQFDTGIYSTLIGLISNAFITMVIWFAYRLYKGADY